MDTSQVTNMYGMFGYCTSLVNVPQYDTREVVDATALFLGCASLKSLPPLDMSSVIYATDMFSSCESLESLTLPGLGKSFVNGQILGMRDTKLDADAANALMQSLGTVPSSAGYPGRLQLPATATGANTSIATSKNWTVTIG